MNTKYYMIHNNIDETHGIFSFIFLVQQGKQSPSVLSLCHSNCSIVTLTETGVMEHNCCYWFMILCCSVLSQWLHLCSVPVLWKELTCYWFMILCCNVLSQWLQQCSVPVIGKELMCYWFMILCCNVLSQWLQQCSVPVIGKELMCYCIMILCSSVLSQGLQQCTVPVSVGGGVDMSRLGSLSYVAVSRANDFSSGWCLCQGRDGCVSVLGKGLTCLSWFAVLCCSVPSQWLQQCMAPVLGEG